MIEKLFPIIDAAPSLLPHTRTLNYYTTGRNMGFGRLLVNLLVVLAAISGGLWQLKVKPWLERMGGRGRVIESIGNQDCYGVPELQACEKLILHQPSSTLYLACSTPESRVQWTPSTGRLNATGASRTDYVATYNPQTRKVSRLKVTGFSSERGLSLHGMDVVASEDDPSLLWVYLINHRAPLEGDPAVVGADSAVEIFKAHVDGHTLEHVRTVEDPIIFTPNDVIGAPDGQSFYITNEYGVKVGHLTRQLEVLGLKHGSSIAYCHATEGCKYAIQKMHGNNGLTQAPNGTVYVANAMYGGLTVLEKQADHTLVITDVIETDRPMDNVSVDSQGHVWAGALPNALKLVFEHFPDPRNVNVPSSALRFSINTGPDAFFGQKFKVDKVFEDDGRIASGSTSAVYDVDRRILYMSGVASPQLAVCKL